MEDESDFFSQPILNSPYEYPNRHWELDEHGQPTTNVQDARRGADFITPIPKAKKVKSKEPVQAELDLHDKSGISDESQKYSQSGLIMDLRF